MKFKNLREVKNYIPNCIICGKELQFLIELKREYLVKDNFLIAKNKKEEDFKIDIDSNEIINGAPYINLLLKNSWGLSKSCKTCKCSILFHAYNYNIKNNYAPLYAAGYISLIYTLKKSLGDIFIQSKFESDSDDKCITIIRYNNYSKALSTPHLDLSKISDFKQLNKKIALIKTFH